MSGASKSKKLKLEEGDEKADSPGNAVVVLHKLCSHRLLFRLDLFSENFVSLLSVWLVGHTMGVARVYCAMIERVQDCGKRREKTNSQNALRILWFYGKPDNFLPSK